MVSPTRLDPRVGIAAAYERTARSARRPQHRFNLRLKPFQIQPFLNAVVLPGETLTSVMLQTQAWSDPLASGTLRNIGWWTEYMFFYVKHRDLNSWEREETNAGGLGSDLIDMMVNNTPIPPQPDRRHWTYKPPGGVDYVQAAVARIVEEYFRDEGEPWNVATIDGVPLAQIYGRGQDDWAMRLTMADDYEDRRVPLDVDNDGDITVDEVERAYAEWAVAYDAGIIEMDYEDWMRTYGIRNPLPSSVDRVDYHRPELLFHHREFTYPTNTVEPTTGVPATAVGWRTAKQFRKNWLFPEPGWIIGVTIKRPKVYLQNQEGTIASMMTTRDSWLPAVMNDQLDVSHLLMPGGSGPLGTTFPDPYYIDLRDLLNHGEQFLNWEPGEIGPFLNLPLPDGQRRYATNAGAQSYFLNAEGGRFLEDGVVSLSIKGRQKPRGDNLVLGRA